MSNNKPHFSYINVSLLVLSNLKIVFLKKLKKKSRALHCIDDLAYNVRYLLLVQNYGPEIDLRTFLAMFRLVPSGNLKDLDLSVWPRRYQTLRSYSFVSRIRTLVKTLRHHVTILDLFRTLLDPSYYMIHINIVLVNFSRGYY